MLHAVEVDHLGKDDASVVYIAATPTTEMNKIYVKKQAEDFLNRGAVPGNFQSENETDKKEGAFKGWVGEGGILSGLEGRRAMGLVGL